MFNERKRTKLSFSGAYMKCSDVFWQMAALKTRVVNLIARNLREPKGLGGHFIRVHYSDIFESGLTLPCKSMGFSHLYNGKFAQRYPGAMKVILEKRNSGLENEIVKHLNIQRDDKVLEVGFGPGVGLNACLKKVEHCSSKVYGIDISELIVDHAQTHFKEAIERQKLEIHLGSAMELPFTENFFNSVFHTNCYYFWPSLDQGISEMKRVLKPGGIMLTGLVHDRLKSSSSKGFLKYGPNWRPELYIEKLKEGGFVDVALETVTKPSGHSYQVIFASKP